MPQLRQILDADITLISLCQRGKNGFKTLFKSADSTVEMQGLTKAVGDVMEKGQVAAVVWAPGFEGVEGDFADSAAVEKMAHKYMRNQGGVDVNHDQKKLAAEDAYVAESFIIQKGDPRFSEMEYNGKVVDVTDGWGIILQIDNEDLRKGYRDGDWEGVSMFGDATVRGADQKTLDATKLAAVESLFTEDNEMTTEEMKVAMGEVLKSDDFKGVVLDIVETDTAAKAELQKAADEKAALAKSNENTAPEGVDLSDEKAVEAYALSQEIETLKADVDWKNAESVRKFGKAVAELGTTENGDRGGKPADSNLNKGVASGEQSEDDIEDEIKKGREHAALMNKAVGRGK